MTFANSVEKWQLLQRVLHYGTNALIEEKLYQASRLDLVLKRTSFEKYSLLVVGFVVSQVLKIKA